MNITIKDRCNLINSNEEFIVVDFNEYDRCYLRKRGNFLYFSNNINGFLITKTDANNGYGYRNPTTEEYAAIVDYVRSQSPEIINKGKRRKK